MNDDQFGGGAAFNLAKEQSLKKKKIAHDEQRQLIRLPLKRATTWSHSLPVMERRPSLIWTSEMVEKHSRGYMSTLKKRFLELNNDSESRMIRQRGFDDEPIVIRKRGPRRQIKRERSPTWPWKSSK